MSDAGLSPLEASEFERLTQRMLGLAYRMLGSWADAEDVAAQAWLRWHERGPGDVRDPQAWLTTVATRIAVDRWRTLARRREEYIGPWLPEPIDPAVLPHETAEQRESLTLSLLHLMERLNPDERAVYVLRHAFDYPFPEIAQILGRTPASVRQLGHRARHKIGEVSARVEPHRRLAAIDRLARAISEGRVSDAVSLLTADAVLVSDGGGKVKAALRPIVGADKVIRFLCGVAATAREVVVETVPVNGEPAFRVTADAVVRVFHVQLSGDLVSTILVLGNPDKLARVRG